MEAFTTVVFGSGSIVRPPLDVFVVCVCVHSFAEVIYRQVC